MSLETATYVGDLVATNPTATDLRSQGDDQIRLVKSALQATLPNASKPFYFPTTEIITANETVVAADQNKTFLADTTSGSIVLTLPALASGDAGWEVFLIKTNTGTNPVFIAPASGTIQSGAISGLSRTRRCIPGVKTRIFWTGTAWIAERTVNAPVGALLDFSGASLPVGYEWPNGQTLSSASTNYPDFYSANANSGVVVDIRGRVVAGKDDMGGTSADRLTNQTGGLNGDTLGATGGAETHPLTLAQLPEITFEVNDAGHNHDLYNPSTGDERRLTGAAVASGPDFATVAVANAATESGTTAPKVNTTGITITPVGGDEAHNNVQPTIILNKILVVE